MILKEEFLNLINDINSVSIENGYANAKDWSNNAYNKGILSFDEKEELFRFIQMRNMVSHGSADRINIFKEDMVRLKYFKKVLYDMLGIKVTNENVIKDVTRNNKTRECSINLNQFGFDNTLKERNTNKVSDIIRNIFIRQKGKIHISTLTGIEYDVFLSKDGEAFETEALPFSADFEFRIFDVVYDLLKRENGKVKKGNGHNYKLGENGCTDKTVCGIIGYEYFYKKTGDSVFDPVFIICAIMDYAGICKNTRGYLLLVNK